MMNKVRPGFMVYFNDWDAPRRLLTPEQFKEFFDAVFSFARDGEIPPASECAAVNVFFDCIKEKIELDAAKYRETCQRRSEAAKQKQANASKCKQLHAKASKCR